MDLPQLIVMQRDPAVWPPPHRADVAPSMLGEYATNGGWQVAPGQPVAERHAPVKPTGGTVAVLCPGPSLRSVWPVKRRRFGSIIAVNYAAYEFPCDWWFSLDGLGWTYYGTPSPVPRVGYAGCVWMFTGGSAPFSTAGLALQPFDAPPGCQSLTMLAAIAFAFDHLQAAKVEIYGADLAGSGDCRPGKSEDGRTPERWREEKAGLEVLMARYPGRIARILPEVPHA
jgi:hypothetical protein